MSKVVLPKRGQMKLWNTLGETFFPADIWENIKALIKYSKNSNPYFQNESNSNQILNFE